MIVPVFENAAQFGLSVCIGLSVIVSIAAIIVVCVSIVGYVNKKCNNVVGIIVNVAIALIILAAVIFVSSFIGFRILNMM